MTPKRFKNAVLARIGATVIRAPVALTSTVWFEGAVRGDAVRLVVRWRQRGSPRSRVVVYDELSLVPRETEGDLIRSAAARMIELFESAVGL